MPSDSKIIFAANMIKWMPARERTDALRQMLQKFKREAPELFAEAGRIWQEIDRQP